jgi:hypothetical protein
MSCLYKNVLLMSIVISHIFTYQSGVAEEKFAAGYRVSGQVMSVGRGRYGIKQRHGAGGWSRWLGQVGGAGIYASG